MKTTTLVIVLAIAIAIIAGGFFYFNGAKYQPASPMPMQGGNPPQNQNPVAANGINIQNFAFDPTPLTVKAGDTVTWTNNDGAPHQIKSGTFNSAVLEKGQTFSFTFPSAGTFDYSCAIHPSMKGQIIVQ